MTASLAGLALERLPDQPGAAHAEARRFCLATIKAFYGFDHRPDWHADLDSLLRPPSANHYSRVHRGAFWVLRAGDGAVVATVGLQHLGWKPGLLALFPDRYPRGEAVALLGRLYVRSGDRGRGIGRWLVRVCEAEAVRLGYPVTYLHASSDTPATLGFWHGVGYGVIGQRDGSTHFDRRIGTDVLAVAPARAAERAI